MAMALSPKIANTLIANQDSWGRLCMGDTEKTGWLDLFLNRGSPYRNRRPGRKTRLFIITRRRHFTKITKGSVVSDGGQGQSCALGRLRQRWLSDLYCANGGLAVESINSQLPYHTTAS